jgi:hypothetical protein
VIRLKLFGEVLWEGSIWRWLARRLPAPLYDAVLIDAWATYARTHAGKVSVAEARMTAIYTSRHNSVD